MTERPRGIADLPLLRWGAEFAAVRQSRRRCRRGAIAIVALFMAMAATIALPLRPLLIWNASASAPVGLYWVSYDARPRVGDMVIARVPERYRLFAARRRYLPANVPLVKRVAAAPGDSVCASGNEIFVNGRSIAERLPADDRGRSMPWWRGCVALRDHALFLLMDNPASFDGRYFGPTAADDIIGKARLIWPR